MANHELTQGAWSTEASGDPSVQKLMDLLFNEEQRPMTPGTTRPTEEQLARYFERLDVIDKNHLSGVIRADELFCGS